MPNNHLQTIYCTKKCLDYVVQKSNRKRRESCNIAYQLFWNIGDIYLDISKKELIELTQNDPYYSALHTRGNLTLHSIETWGGFTNFDFSGISDEIVMWDNNDNSFYRDKYGCLVISKDSELDILIDFARKSKGYCIAPHNERLDKYVAYSDSWNEVLTNINGGSCTKYILPLNSIIISDNYMFTNKYESRKLGSLFEIIKALIPNNSNIEYHVSIFTSNANSAVSHLTKDQAENIINEIRALNLTQNIKLSIVTHKESDPTHDRLILTNYHVIHSGKGFSVIENNGRIAETAKGEVFSVFHNIDYCDPSSFSKKHLHHDIITWFNKIYIENDTETNQNIKNEFFIVGDGVKNRLLR